MSQSADNEHANGGRRRAVLFVGLGAAEDRHAWGAQGFGSRATALAATLPAGWEVLHAEFRGRPCIAGALAVLEDAGVDELVVVPDQPHFSHRTTGVVLAELYRVLARMSSSVAVAVRTSWHDDVAYVNAQATLIAEYVSARGLDPATTRLAFWARAPSPDARVPDDPYEAHVRRTVDLVTERLGWPVDLVSLDFVGTDRPMAPPQDDTVLICPITFPTDPDEVRAHVADAGSAWGAKGARLHVCPSLDTHDGFLAALRDIVLRGTRPMPPGRPSGRPLLAGARVATGKLEDSWSLVMVGAALPGRLGLGGGPRVRYSDPDAFARVKRERRALREFLRWVAERRPASDAFVWNTCQRVEFYGWLEDPDDIAERECQVARIRHRLFGAEPTGLRVNVLIGREAWHHLSRTACGLNSRLPGDRDVVEQLQAAGRVAACAGAAGPRTKRAIERTVALAHGVWKETEWGAVSTGYCTAALTHIVERTGMDPGALGHVVVGGSITSRAILSVLKGRFEVPEDRLTIAYRDHHGQLKLIRGAIGQGRRLRVHRYDDRRVVGAVREADFLYFGIDHADAVLDPRVLRGLRDFTTHPLTIVDFNSFGSLGAGEVPDGVTVLGARELDAAVEAYADRLCEREDFPDAVVAAERRIAQQPAAPSSAATWSPCPAMGS